MSLEKILKKHLPAALFSQVVDELGDDFDFDYVPRARLNAVIKQRNDLRQQIEVLADEDDEVETQEKDLTKKPPAKTKEKEPDVDLDKIKADYEAQIEAVKLEYALTDALKEAGVNNPKLLMPQLDKQAIKLGEDGKLEGLADQITAWKESDPYLFKESDGSEGVDGEGTGASGLTGAKGSKGKTTPVDAELKRIFGDDFE